MRHPNTLDPKQSALIVIDMQEAFRSAIPDFALIAERTSIAVRGFRALEIPILVTEQYPAGLGNTVEEVRLCLSDGDLPIEKTTFSSCGSQDFMNALKAANAKQIVVCGIEAHICVNQTVHDLIANGFQVHVLQDCVSSRTNHDKHTGIEKMKIAGAIPSNIEMVFFELLKDAKHSKFMEIQALIK